MKSLFAALTLVVPALFVTAPAFAQVKTITGESIVKTATVEAINYGTREVTLKSEDGRYHVITASDEVKRFNELKVGDVITARYYENITIRLKAPGEKDVDAAKAADTRGGGARPAGTVAEQRTITATITELDRKVPSITFKGPNNWTYSSRVEDRKAIEKVKVGDKVDITWTEAVLLGVEPAPKK
jgi:hypothetical protein